MIIFEDLGILTRSDVPNADWTGGEAKYVVDDNSELAAKVMSNAPYFEPIEDEQGNLIDIKPLPRPEQRVDVTAANNAVPVSINEIYENQLLIMEALTELRGEMI